MALLAQTFSLTAAADGVKRWIDPNGTFGNAVSVVAVTQPTVTRVSGWGQRITKGNVYTAVFSSDYAGFWEIKAGFDGHTKSVSSDGRVCTVSWTTPAGKPGESYHVTAMCKNFGGEAFAFDIVHVSVNNVLLVGSGQTYADLHAAYAAAISGDTIIVMNGIYSADNFQTRIDGYGANQPYEPPTGNFTLDTGGTDPVRTITQMTSVMAETPFGVILDGHGVWGSCFTIQGNTAFEADYAAEPSMGQDWHLTGAGTDRCGIKFAGFVCKNTVGANIWVYHCDHIKLQYCMAIDGNTPPGDSAGNGSSIRFQNSTDCLGEYCYSCGDGRLKFSTYQSKRTLFRRGVFRNDQRDGTDPMGGVNLYRTVDSAAQNCLQVDSNTSEFWPAVTDGHQGAFGISSTGINDLPHDCYFQRCGAIHSEHTFIAQDGYDAADDIDNIVFEDMWAYDIALPDNNSLVRDGPMIVNRASVIKIDLKVTPDIDKSNAFHDGRSRQTWNGLIVYMLGWDRDTDTATDQGPIFFTGQTASESINMNGGYIYESTSALGLNTGNGGDLNLVDVNDETDNPFDRGLMYPGRVESGSILEADGDGPNNFYLAKGAGGTFYGETDWELETEIDWLGKCLYELAAVHFKTHSYTGPVRSGGSATLSGDRGFCADGEDLRDYITSAYGYTPFPTISGQKQGAGLKVSWHQFAANHNSNIAGFEIYLDNELAQITAANIHEVVFSSLVAGHTYTAKVVAVDSVTGDSGPSYEFTVAM